MASEPDPLHHVDLHSDDEEADCCRICRCSGTPDNQLFYPCRCSGSIKYVHQSCLQAWLEHSGSTHCEVSGCWQAFRDQQQQHPDVWPYSAAAALLHHHTHACHASVPYPYMTNICSTTSTCACVRLHAGLQAQVCVHTRVCQGCSRDAAMARVGFGPGEESRTGYQART